MSGISGTSPVSVTHTPAEGSSATVALASGYGDTQNPYASKTANHALAAPDGTAGVPTFRALVANDIPSVIPKSTFTTKGDILATSGASTPTRLAVGSNNQVLTADSSTATGVKWATLSGALKYIGQNTYNATTTITPSTVSPNAKMAMITVIGGGGGGGACPATTVTQVSVSENGARGNGIQAILYNSSFYSTNCAVFSDPWDIIIGAGGTGGVQGVSTGASGGNSQVSYPAGAKSPEWSILGGYGWGAGSNATAVTPPFYRTPNTNGSNSSSCYGAASSTPIEIKRTDSIFDYQTNRSYATSVSFGFIMGLTGAMADLNTDYMVASTLTRSFDSIVNTANSTFNGDARGRGVGGASKLRLGTNAAATNGNGGTAGTVVITWFG
jgi:hypothetical protein